MSVFVNYRKKCGYEIDPMIEELAKNSPTYCKKYPIARILKAAAKIFYLNEIEILYLAYVLNITKWNQPELEQNQQKIKFLQQATEKIKKLVKQFKPFIILENIENPQQCKELQLYVLFACHCVKYYFTSDTKQYMQECDKYLDKFYQNYRKWVKKFKQLTSTISIRELNQLYIKLSSITESNTIDFNFVVDTIVQLSPAYNSQKSSNNNFF